jgi:hypothetical protein
MALIIVFLLIVIGGLIYLLNNYRKKATEMSEKLQNYQGIMDIDQYVKSKQEELNKLDSLFSTMKDTYNSKRTIYENLLTEIATLEENLEYISYGIYKPHFNYDTSDKFKKKLQDVQDELKEIIKKENATYCPIKWEVGGSLKEGEKMMKQASKLMLRAFNGECDAAIAKVTWNNIGNMEARIEKAYEAINKLGSTNQISITSSYKDLKLKELRLEFELEEQLYKEKEEQRRIKEQMREEEKAQKELEKAKEQAEAEEQKYQKALEKAKLDVEKATGKQLDDLNEKIRQLEQSLILAQQQKARAISQAQMTKSGHVYVISNIGAFGDNVFKIGMTRRLEPMDRIKELGDASVPFDFDVHAIIYSDNAPELENTLHKKFDNKRVNLVNTKREFFNVPIEDIEKVVQELGLTIHLTKVAEAREYRESKSLRNGNAPTNKAIDEKMVMVNKFFENM